MSDPESPDATQAFPRPSDATLSGVDAAAVPLAPGGYEILGEIAAGGMGVIYRARQVPLGRIVAFKRIHAALVSPAAVQRFRLEAEAIAELDHPNIVPVYDVGVLEGQPYFSMKLVEGGNLGDWIAKLNKLGGPERAARLREGVRLLALVARAVSHAHERGILHRDLKPANVLLERPPGGEVPIPYVTDFGLAKRLTPGEGDSEVTMSGTIVGTPAYMAPEQAVARKDLTTAVDVYSLGAILYEMLTGRPPFTGDSPFEVLRQLIDQEPPSPRSLRPDADRDLEAVCLRCLEKDRQRRLASAADLADELERWLDGQPVRTRPASVWERGVKWVRRRPAIAALSALVVLLAVGGVAGIAWEWRREQVARRAAQEMSAALALREAWHNSDEEQTGPAMLWAARAMELSGDPDLRRAAGANLAAWAGRMHRLEEMWQAEQEMPTLLFPTNSETGLGFKEASANVYIVDPRTGKSDPRPDLLFLKLPVRVFATDPKGIGITAVGDDGILWYDTGRHIVQLVDKGVTALAHASDWRLASGSRSGAILISSLPGQNEQAELQGPKKPVTALAFSPDDKRLVSGYGGGQIALWDLATRKPILPDESHSDDIAVVRFSPDGRLFLSGSDDHTARIWDTATGKLRATVEHQDYVRTATFSPDSTKILTGSHDRTARLWDAATGRPVGTALSHRKPVVAVTFIERGKRAVTYSQDGTGRVWSLAGGADADASHPAGGEVFAVALHAESGRVLVGAAEGISLILDEEARPAGPALKHPDEVWAVAWHPDGTTAYTGCRDGAVRAWDVRRGAVVNTWKGSGYVRALSMHPAGGSLLVARGDRDRGSASMIDLKSGKEESLDIGRSPVYAAAFSPDGRRYATSAGEGVVQVWETGSRRMACRTLDHPARVVALAFAPDGRSLATGSTDQRARLWDVQAGQALGEPMTQRGAVWSVAFHPDGHTLATGGRARGVRLWDVKTGRRVGPDRRHDGVVWAMTFAPDGRSLWTGCSDRRVRRWSVPELELAGDARRLRLWCETITGLRLDERGEMHVLDRDEWLARRKQLDKLGGAPE